MKIINRLSDKDTLIIDDIPGMRIHVQNKPFSLGLEKLSVAGSRQKTLVQLSRASFDIIMCDCYLDDPTSAIAQQT